GARHALRLALAHLRVPRSRDGRAEEADTLRRSEAVREPGTPADPREGGRAARGRGRRNHPPRVRRDRRHPAAARKRRRVMNTVTRIGVLALALVAPILVHPSARADEPRVVAVTAKRFEFEPKEVHVKKGESVVLEVTSQDVTHGFFSRKFGFDE